MARNTATKSDSQRSEVRWPKLQVAARPEHLVLEVGERDVLRLLGPAVLESVREFGAAGDLTKQ